MGRVLFVIALSCIVVLFVLFCVVRSDEDTFTDRSSRNEIASLPGFKGVLQSRHHGGYLTVDKERRSHLYYYFVESENDPQNDPLVLWLNGGPGCSSFDGFVYEHGPFNFNYNSGDVKLEINPYAWSKVANMIFLDSPAGTGLSYSEGVKYYVTDDLKTATDLHTAVNEFLELFPEFSSNRFFVAGESYAGVYVPLLVYEIAKANAAGNGRHINLVGYLVGNGVTDEHFDGQAFPPFAVGKSLIPSNLYTSIYYVCQGLFWNATADLQNDAYRMLFSNPLNIYNVAGKCDLPPEEFQNRDPETTKRQINAFVEENGWVWPLGPVRSSRRVHNWKTAINSEPPCTDYWTCETWLNRGDVREAIHAAPVEETGDFLLCSNRLVYTKSVSYIFDIHSRLIRHYGLHALIFSGDHDMAVPHTGTELWTNEMRLPIVTQWDSWLDPEGQVAGYYVDYKGMTYCTVRNAGHMVPQTHPVQALEMFRRFLKQLSMREGPPRDSLPR